MIGKVKVTSISYGEFAGRLLLLELRATDAMIYAEWNKCLRREGSINYGAHATAIRRKLAKHDRKVNQR
jgi:hypothetical protein